MKQNLLNVTPIEAQAALNEFLERENEPSYRSGQILRHLWQVPVRDFEEITVLPRDLRARLGEAFELPSLQLESHQVSRDGTEKFLFRLHDGQEIETVAIPERNRLTLCISSQAGCALKCAFCATGAMGFSRNLSAFEIAGQVREVNMMLAQRGAGRVTNIVFMGMGEPLMNWSAVDPTLTILNSPDGIGIGARHITVSTVGILPGIVALSNRKEQFRLAISIHAPNDSLRHDLMPINTKYPLADVIDAARAFDRRVTFEYVMLGGVNDGFDHALQLADLALDCRAFVNLIPLHPGGTGNFIPTDSVAIQEFANTIRNRGVEVAVRKSRGMDISAACGQLRVERQRRRRPVVTNEDSNVHVA